MVHIYVWLLYMCLPSLCIHNIICIGSSKKKSSIITISSESPHNLSSGCISDGQGLGSTTTCTAGGRDMAKDSAGTKTGY